MSALDNLGGTIRKLEAALAARVEGTARRVTGSPAAARHPLEIVLAVVDAVEQEIQPAGRGRRALPFTHVRVAVAAATDQIRARLQMAFEGPPAVGERIADRLEAAGCGRPALDVDVAFEAEPQASWSHGDFDLQFRRVRAEPAPCLPARLELTITHGSADRFVYVFDAAPIGVGRGGEVRDDRQRLLRTNQVAFTEGGGDVNQSVSRRHARIEHDVTPGGYRLFDDGSSQGTSVIRRGRGVPVPCGAKGLRLQSGDEIVLGQARMRVKLTPITDAQA